jgi:glycosyltransferase involved in cell wall biosynthesis
MTKVNIVMPSYNSESYLDFALNSVAQQTYPDIELLIFDGGSSDGSLKIIKSYRNRLKLRLVSEHDEGVNDACRKGFSTADAKYLCHLCSTDGYFDPNFIATSVKFLESNTDYEAIFSSGAQELDENGKPLYQWRPWVQPFFKLIPYAWHKTIAVQHAVPFPDMGWLVKRDRFVELFPAPDNEAHYGQINPFLGFIKAIYSSNVKFAILDQISSFGRHHPGQWGTRVAQESKASIADFKRLKFRRLLAFELGWLSPLIRIWCALLFLFCFIIFGGPGYYFQKIAERLKRI